MIMHILKERNKEGEYNYSQGRVYSFVLFVVSIVLVIAIVLQSFGTVVCQIEPIEHALEYLRWLFGFTLGYTTSSKVIRNVAKTDK